MRIKYRISLLFILSTVLTAVAGNSGLANHAGANPDTVPAKKRIFSNEKEERRRDPRSVIKMNLSQLALKNLSFQYEFAFHKNFSIALGASQFLARPLPGLFKEDDPAGEGLRNTSYKGFAITPEIRFYPGRKVKHQAPRGFYLAGYLRRAKYTLTSSYYDTFNAQTYGYNLTATYAGYSGGLMIGYQWIIARHISIDLWILGGGAGKANFSLNATTQGLSIPADEQAHINQTLHDELSKANYLHAADPVIETTDHSVKATMNGLPMLSYRGFGLCIGFAF